MAAKKKIIVMGIGEDDALGFKANSFVDFPAIEADFIALNKMVMLQQMDEERRIVYGPVLIPDQLILRVDDKTHEEYYIQFPRDVIKNVAYGMMKKGAQSDATVMHAVPVADCTIVETWLKEGESDKSIQLGFKSFPDGTWFIGTKVDNDQVWNDIKAGKLRGYSIEAMMREIEMKAHGLTPEEEFLEELSALPSLTN